MVEFIEFPALGALVAFGIAIIGLVIETRRQRNEREQHERDD